MTLDDIKKLPHGTHILVDNHTFMVYRPYKGNITRIVDPNNRRYNVDLNHWFWSYEYRELRIDYTQMTLDAIHDFINSPTIDPIDNSDT